MILLKYHVVLMIYRAIFTGFPNARDFKMDRSVPGKVWGGGKSLFAQQFDRKYNYTPKTIKSNILPSER